MESILREYANTWQHLPHLLLEVQNVNNRRFTEFFGPLLPHPSTDRNETRTWSSLSPRIP